MGCFDNIISYKGGCSSVSGLLLDDLIPIREAEKYTGEDYATAYELIDAKIDFSVRLIKKELIGMFQDNYIPRTILENKRAGFIAETQTLKAAAAQYRGIELRVCNQESYLSLYVSSIDTYLNYTGALNVLVIDTMTGQTLDTIAVTSVAGEVVTTYVNKTYNAEKRKRRIAFVYDCTSIPNYLTSLIGEGCTTCHGGQYNLNDWITGRSIKYDVADTPILANIDGHTDTAGLSINFSLICDQEGWLCAHRNLLALPIMYRTAQAILEYAYFNSERFNAKTAIRKDEIKERIGLYHSDYTKQMELILKNIKTPMDGICFTCKPRSKSVTTLP